VYDMVSIALNLWMLGMSGTHLMVERYMRM
jgi:hypothetical protein